MDIQVIDSHTGGEPTRVVINNVPQLGDGPLSERLARFRDSFDHVRRALVTEPRGSEAMVGALLARPVDASCITGVIFFNNSGYLGMCGHGAIGVAATLHYLKKVTPGNFKIETPVGIITVQLQQDGQVTIGNVPSYRFRKDVCVAVEGFGTVTGDVAWGGNWFFLVKNEIAIPLDLKHLEQLTALTWKVRQALERDGVAGRNGAEIDHIELYGLPQLPDSDSRNFVLCPGKSYDRSPCGTGTSAKMACLYSDGKLKEGQIWRQESVTGSTFEGHVVVQDGDILPFIKGSAFVTGAADLVFDERDPFCWGIPA